MNKILRLLAVSLLPLACAPSLDGPAPSISAVVNPLDPDRSPAVICSAQAAETGWRLEIRGDGFSPLPSGVLTDSPGVLLPSVKVGEIDIRAADLRFSSPAAIAAYVPTADTTPPQPLAEGSYAVQVTNPNGKSATLADAVTVVPPPTFASIVAPTGFAPGAPNPVVITGTGFRADAPPVVKLSGTGLPTYTLTDVTVASATEVRANVPPDALAGTYDLEVTNPEGCGFKIPGALKIDYLVLGTLTIDPRFGWQLRNQPITIYNSPTGTQKSFSGGAPEVFIQAPLKTDPTAVVELPLRRTAYVSPSIITAVVPDCSGNAALPITDAACPNGIQPGGPYALRVRDPSGAVGTIPAARGFVVLQNAPPVITQLSPEAIDTNGLPSSIASELVVTGQNFGASPKLQLLELLSTGDILACDLPVTQATATQVRATVPTSVAQASCRQYDPLGNTAAATSGFSLRAGLYVVRVQNTTDPAYSDFSGLIVTNPAANPANGPAITTRLATARMDFPLVSATNDLGQSFLYALGGFDGTSVLSSVEVAPITLFGDVGGDCSSGTCVFRTLDRTALGASAPAPRRGHDAVVRAVDNDTSYIYVIGGEDQAGTALTTVERAQVLKTSDAPSLLPPQLQLDGGSATPGTFYYQVSAVLSGTDPLNPGGESLPSDEYPVTYSGSARGSTLTWTCVPSATAYRVYRTPTANAASGSEVLLREVAAAAACTGSPLPTESFVDTGLDPASAQRPLPPGALGKWVAMPPLAVQRSHPAALLDGDRLYVTGGRCSTVGAGCGAANATLASTEIGTFTAGSPTLTAFAAGPTLAQARQRHALGIAEKRTAPNSFSSGTNDPDAWLIALGGDQGGAAITTNKSEVMKIRDGSGPIASPTWALGNYNLGSLHGGWCEVIANQLIYAGSPGGANFTLMSERVCPGTGNQVGQCTAAASFTGTLNSSGSTVISTLPRYLTGETLFRAFIYVAGGAPTDTSTSPLSSISRVVY